MAFLFIAVIIQFYSCANIVSPTGGPKDTTPPRMAKATPENYSTNFKASDIGIYFDEYIQLKDIEGQLIISPPLEKMPDIKLKGKGFQLHINEQLKENTTYTINFSNAIGDLTENNIIEDFQYVFSTGSYIDSLYITGKVKNAKSHLPEKNVLVMLYENTSDSVPYKERPLYFGKTKENGEFKITNLKKGNLKLFALKDENSNYLFDQPAENIAFPDSLIDTQRKDSITLRLFENQNSKQRLLRASSEGFGKIVFIFSQPFHPLSINLLGEASKKEWELIENSKNRDTLIYWYTEPTTDSLHFLLSDDKGPVDTAHIELDEKVTKSAKNKFGLYISTNISVNSFNLSSNIHLRPNHPIKDLDSKKIILLEDSIAKTNFTISKDSTLLRQYNLQYPWKENARYKLLLPKGTFLDIFGLTNDSLIYNFGTKGIEDYGTLRLKLNVPFSPTGYVVQLLDEKDNVNREHFIKGDEVIQYEYLDPKKYRLKIIFDSNGNNRWDSGNYLERKQPEKTFFYAELITVRANWDMEVEWKIKP